WLMVLSPYSARQCKCFNTEKMNVTDGFLKILTTCWLLVHSVTPSNVVIYANDDYELTRLALVARLFSMPIRQSNN
ncbi:hypothetical protein, partial [Nostoc sp.]|uniref:hypothetical protein n=1 Tax=Nostoc sp. TaxID=1180 RepID=UPI002FF549FB